MAPSYSAHAASRLTPYPSTMQVHMAPFESNSSSGTRCTVAVAGLGIMGSAMSANLLAAGFRVIGYDPVEDARLALAQAGGEAVASIRSLAASSDRFLLSLPTAEALLDTARELAGHAAPGSIVADASTLAHGAKQAARGILNAAGMVLLDTPVSGTGAQARRKDIVVYASGDTDAIAAYGPIFAGFARNHYDLGTFGNGMSMKLASNLLVAIHNVAAAEAILVGMRAGLAPETMVEILADGGGQSRMLEIRGPLMIARAWDVPTVKASVFDKDLALIGEAVRTLGIQTPLLDASVPVYRALMARGHRDHDTAAVFAVLEEMARG